MALSEHERNVLERLERDFEPTATPGALPGRWRPTRSRRRALASVGLPVGLLLMLLALVMNTAAGVALALVAYGIITGSASILVADSSRSRATPAEWTQAAPTPRRSWYLR